MANMYRCGSGSSGKQVYELGTGTSFDIKTLLPEIDYTKLTTDNFLISSISGTPALTYNGYRKQNSAYDDPGEASSVQAMMISSMSIVKSYDSTTGVLTLYAQSIAKLDKAYWYNFTKNYKCNVTAYLIF